MTKPRFLLLLASCFIVIVLLAIRRYRLHAAVAAECATAYTAMHDKGDLTAAQSYLQHAAALAPTDEEVVALTHYLNGFAAFKQDHCREAVQEFEAVLEYYPYDVFLQMMVEEAKSSLDFDAGNYQSYLAHRRSLASVRPQDPYTAASVASAYACLYVTEHNEKRAAAAHTWLNNAKQLGKPDDAALALLCQRIEHRLATKQIITAQQFTQQFPNGWPTPEK